MRKAVVILAVALAACLVLEADASQRFFADNPAFEYNGRVDLSDPGIARFDWSSVSITFQFTGNSVTFLLNDNGNQYGVSIDGIPYTVFETKIGKIEYPYIIGYDEPGPHTVVLTKRTEASFDLVSFLGVKLAAGGELLRVPIPKGDAPLRIEFLGDSLTCGYGALGVPPCSFSAQTEDAGQSFAGFTARALNAVAHVECWSGKGVVRNYGDKSQVSERPFPFYFGRTLANYAISWVFERFQPDIVVVTLGGNDVSPPLPVPYDLWSQGYFNFLKRIYSVYPRVRHVVVSCGPLHDCTNYGRVVEQFERDFAQNRTVFMPMDFTLTVPEDYGCDGHPSAQGHKKMADKLIQQLRKIL